MCGYCQVVDQPLLEGKEEDALRSIAKEQTGTPRTILKVW